MAIQQTRTEIVAEARVSDTYDIEIEVLGKVLQLNTDDASVFADEIYQACTDATIQLNQDRAARLQPLGIDRAQLRAVHVDEEGLHAVLSDIEFGLPGDGGDAA
jgi:hypothetical protein